MAPSALMSRQAATHRRHMMHLSGQKRIRGVA
ncbi:MAG: hypothetical protein ACD_75C02342G0004 [uncultured bacterium]|nr:MAG: hypothetical protein ACD_75C02342G0004 [uncultured bacterium]